MQNQSHIVALVGFAIVNGIFSPATAFAFLLHPVWYPVLLPATLPLVFFLSSLIVATTTIMLAGVPAALFQRFAGRPAGDITTSWIWLSAAALLSLPGVVRAIGTV